MSNSDKEWLRRQDISRIEYMQEYRKEWRKRNKEKIAAKAKLVYNTDELARNKQKARAAVKNAIRDGRLIKPSHCENCCFDYELQAHHEDYAKPFEIKWLCVYCHNNVHKESFNDNSK